MKLGDGTSAYNDLEFSSAYSMDSTPITTEGDGSAYTATVPWIKELVVGMSFIMVPHVVSTSTSPTLNVNGLGAKRILRRTTAVATGSQPGASTSWLLANYPFRVIYDGICWVVEGQPKPTASDLFGTVAEATKASQDGEGNVIVDTYATKSIVSSLQSQILVDSFIMADAITGDLYKIQIQNGQLVSFAVSEEV